MSAGNAQYRRLISEAIYALNKNEVADFRIEEIDTVFRVGWLAHFPMLATGRSNREIGQACMNIRYAIGDCDYRGGRSLSTVSIGSVIDKPFSEIEKGFGVGVTSLAFFLDVMTAFGIRIEGMPAPSGAAALARRVVKRTNKKK